MPYVPSLKTDGKSQDRILIDVAVERAAELASHKISAEDNFSLVRVYRKVFTEVALTLRDLVNGVRKTSPFAGPNGMLAEIVFSVGERYEYAGAFLGELNYAITRFIQRVPQIMVEKGKWPEKNELRYWSYACATEPLFAVAVEAMDWGIGIGGVFNDILLEYKERVNRAYEMAQIEKSGDCYDTPYYSRMLPVFNSAGKQLGHVSVYMPRSKETLGVDVLDCVLVTRQSHRRAKVR